MVGQLLSGGGTNSGMLIVMEHLVAVELYYIE